MSANVSYCQEKRQRIDTWLKHHLKLNDLHGLQWFGGQNGGLFSISWSHKSAHNWDTAKVQNNVFLAYHRARGGGHHRQAPNYKELKQNLRCALRGSRHLRHERALSKSRGCDAFRVYRFLTAEQPPLPTSASEPPNVSLPELVNIDFDLMKLESSAAEAGPFGLSPDALSTSNYDNDDEFFLPVCDDTDGSRSDSLYQPQLGVSPEAHQMLIDEQNLLEVVIDGSLIGEDDDYTRFLNSDDKDLLSELLGSDVFER